MASTTTEGEATPAPAVLAPAEESTTEEYTSAALNARELEWAINPPELLAEHKRVNGSVVRTRCVFVSYDI